MPIVGQFGSLAGLGPLMLPGGAMESIATVTVGSGGASSITFSDIPGGFQHLQVRMIARYASGSSWNSLTFQFNTDTTATNYRRHVLEGNGSVASAGQGQQSYLGIAASSGISANIFTGLVYDILDYGNTSKNKVVRAFYGTDANGSGLIDLESLLWINTNAVTSLKIAGTTYNLAQYSTAALYGIR